MKKIMGLLLMMGLMVSFGGCGKDTPTGASEEITKGPQGQTIEVYNGENEDGDKIEYQFYRNGNEIIKHGYYKAYGEDGQIDIESAYKEDERWSGEWEVVMDDLYSDEWISDSCVYDEEGKSREWACQREKRARLTYSDGKLGFGILYWGNGTKLGEGGLNDEGLMDGKWIFYFENGQIKRETNYKNGEWDGKYIKYDKNGQIREEVNYKDGERDGKSVWYSENGQISETNYKDGEKDGKWVEYDKNGQVIYEGEYKEGKEWSGKFIGYYYNGQLHHEWNYKDGERDGKQVDYDEEGNITSEYCYDMGEYVDCP